MAGTTRPRRDDAPRDAVAKYAEIQHHVFELSRRQQTAEAFAIAGQQGRAALDGSRAAIEKIAQTKQARLITIAAQADRIYRQTTLWQILGATIGAISALGLLWGISIFQIARPLTRMARLTRRIAEGELDVPIQDGRRNDEIGVLVRSLKVFRENALVTRALIQERERANAELETCEKRRRSVESREDLLPSQYESRTADATQCRDRVLRVHAE